MDEAKREDRRRRIEAAAVETLAEMGFRKTSMLQIARRAKASNETLYAWYGNKQGLFSSIITGNSGALHQALDSAVAEDEAPLIGLERIGRLLLAFTATEKAVVFNRAAIADATDTGLLAAAVESEARRPILERLSILMQRYHDSGALDFGQDRETAVDIFIGLLLGELQVQQALGTLQPLSEQEIIDRSERATRLFLRLYTATA